MQDHVEVVRSAFPIRGDVLVDICQHTLQSRLKIRAVHGIEENDFSYRFLCNGAQRYNFYFNYASFSFLFVLISAFCHQNPSH